MRQRRFILLPLVLTVILSGIVGYILYKNSKLKKESQITFPVNDSTVVTPAINLQTPSPQEALSPEVIHYDSIYSPPSSVWREFTVDGCGKEAITEITFSLPPGIWNITKVVEDNSITYFASNVEPTMDFNFGCITDKTKFNPEIVRCSSEYTEQELIKFNVGGIYANSCYEPLGDRLWPFYLPVDKKSQSQINIWSHNINKDTLANLLAWFRFNYR